MCLFIFKGRARPSLAQLYNWRYKELGDLPNVRTSPEYLRANPGFAYDYQFIDVPDLDGRGESEPVPHFYQVRQQAVCVQSMNQLSTCQRAADCVSKAQMQSSSVASKRRSGLQEDAFKDCCWQGFQEGYHGTCHTVAKEEGPTPARTMYQICCHFFQTWQR